MAEYRLQFSTVTLVTTVAFCCSFTGGSFPDLKCHSCSVGDVMQSCESGERPICRLMATEHVEFVE